MKENSNTVPEKNLTIALANLYSSWKTLNQKYKVSFNTIVNQWSVYGAILGEGDSQGIGTINFGSNTVVLLAAGDNNTSDIDLCITSGDSNLECDTKKDSKPIVVYSAKDKYYYGFKTTNHTSRGRSLILTSTSFVSGVR